MSAIFGEILNFGQANDREIQLRVTGDEFYATYETIDGYTAVSDSDRGYFCYAALVNGALVSTGEPASGPPPPGTLRHLRESLSVRNRRFEKRWQRGRPMSRVANEAARTFGPNQGLLEGRRLSSGAVRGLTILVEFQDVQTTVTQADLHDLLNGENYARNGNFCSAREYFRIVSSGKLDYTNDVVGPFRLSQNRNSYLTHLLVKEALDLAVAAGTDLNRYDSRGEGVLDALNILYAGQTQYDGELWPHNFNIDLRYGNISTNLYLLTSAGRSVSDLSIGTFCHENGHLLCRFPDMYDYGAVNREGDGVKSAGIGSYCLMGSGNHLNFGRTPSPVCAYLRDLVGWCDNEISLNSATEVEAVHGDYRSVLKFKTAVPNEYFIAENRSKLGLDQYLSSSGLALYHCDIMGSNEFQQGTGQRHYQCALLQADGHTDLEHNVNQGDGDDLFAGVNGVAVSHATTPSSRLWNGSDSGLVLSSVAMPGARLKFRVGEVAPEPSIRAENTTTVMIPDNNPAGVSSTISIGESGMVKQFTLSLDITHTYIGDLIVELTGPGGQKAILHNRTGAGTDNLVTSYDSMLLAALATFVGLSVQGDWVLKVQDVAGQDVGKLNRWMLDVVVEGGAQIVRGEAAPKLFIPDNTSAGVSSSITLNQPGSVSQMKVSIDITHTYIGDLRIEFVSPVGRRIILHSQLGGSQDNLVVTYDSMAPLSPLSGLAGQPIQGTWTLRVTDVARADTGTLNTWSLEIMPMG
ncbi:M6 family metalloprotease domain-containing protein [Desulfopila sp. IMCC35006]|nr:M6 family metalloprotease domain-containing protein [Desulfopila sp. IMCC35006]